MIRTIGGRRQLVNGVLVAVTVLLSSALVLAHHSFAAEFDSTKHITIKGALTRAELVNPHGWLHVDVKDDSGKVVNWAVEMGGANALYRRGWRVTDLPIGRTLVIDGYLAKDGTHTLNGISITFEDGKKLFAGSSAPGIPGGE